MRTRFFLSFFCLGLVSLIAQVLLLREIMVTFYGNELFLGIGLGCWLFWTAVGSFWGKKWFSQKIFLSTLIIQTALFPLSLILARFLKTFFPLGILVDFPLALGLTFFSLAPLGFFLGLFFATAFTFANLKKMRLSLAAGRAYMFETLGFAFGGLLFDLWLIHYSPILLTLCLSLITLLLTFLYLKKKLLLLPLFLILCLAFYYSPAVEEKTLAWQFPGLIKTENSIYGRMAVTKIGGQSNFFESGALTGTSQKTEGVEYLTHPILLQHSQPNRILMLGGGLDGVLGEILKHQPEKITYVELDPNSVQIFKDYLQPDLRQVLKDPRINLVFIDPRKFLKETEEKYDLVILNLPPPSTALINRLYTQEALREIKKTLAKNGLLAINLSWPTDYLSPEAANLGGCLYQTIKREFSQIMILPEYSLLFLASNQEVLTDNARLLWQRLKAREVETDFISQSYLENRLNDDRIKMFTESFEKDKKIQINTDFFPIAHFYQTAFWQGYFSVGLAKFFRRLPSFSPYFFALIFAGLFFLSLRKRQVWPIIVLALTGATIMTWEVILIFAFQVKLGFIYQKISLLLAIILVGMSLGNYLAGKYFDFKKHLKIILLLMVLFSLGLPIILEKADQSAVFFSFAALAGILTGTVFPLATQAYVKRKKQIGLLYAADLAGAFLGTVIASLFFIPLLGLKTTSFLLAIFLLFPLPFKYSPQKFGR